jgi:thymidylate kinase
MPGALCGEAMQRYPFVCIEGPDGVGKTTIAHAVVRNVSGIYYKTPPRPYSDIRKTIDERASALARFNFYLSSVQFASIEVETLLQVAPVVCDRWIYSTLAYHAAMGFRPAMPRALIESVLAPDRTILLLANEDERLRRLQSRPDTTTPVDDLEESRHFIARVVQEFLSFGLESLETSGLRAEQVVERVMETLSIRRP